jgi:hypothetical protein
MLMNDLIKMRIFELLSEASLEVTNDELQNAYGELLGYIRCFNSNSQFLSFRKEERKDSTDFLVCLNIVTIDFYLTYFLIVPIGQRQRFFPVPLHPCIRFSFPDIK